MVTLDLVTGAVMWSFATSPAPGIIPRNMEPPCLTFASRVLVGGVTPDYTKRMQGYGPEERRPLRLTFAYRGEKIELVEVQRVAMFVPPGDSLEDREARSGFWLELRDSHGSLVFRQAMHHVLANDYEVFPEDPAGEIVRRPVPERSGAFTIVIPELTEAESLVFMASPSAPETRSHAAAEVARFEMAAVRRRAEARGRP
jgi:hypothetical protein